MVAKTLRIVETDGTGLASLPFDATYEVTGSTLVPINFGETSSTGSADSGNANLLMAQSAILQYSGTLQSIAFFVTAAAGNLRLGIYRNNGPNGGPGTLVAQTASFVPVVGWNTQPLSGNLTAGTFWLVYTASSNGLGFRLAANGEFRSASRTFQAMPTTFPAVTGGAGAHWAFYATVLVDSALLVPEPPPPPVPGTGLITTFVGTAANWSNPSTISGHTWYNHHGGRAWSLTKVDNTTLRMEVRQGDSEAIDVGGERSEIAGTNFPPNSLIDVEFDYVFEPGAAFVVGQGNLEWLTLLQCHGDVVRAFWIGFEANERIFLTVNEDSGIDQRKWHSAAPLVRGQSYHFRLQAKLSPSTPTGFVKLWIDGAQVANFKGIRLSAANNGDYLKLGLYRGWNGLIPQTMAVRYSNIKVAP